MENLEKLLVSASFVLPFIFLKTLQALLNKSTLWLWMWSKRVKNALFISSQLQLTQLHLGYFLHFHMDISVRIVLACLSWSGLWSFAPLRRRLSAAVLCDVSAVCASLLFKHDNIPVQTEPVLPVCCGRRGHICTEFWPQLHQSLHDRCWCARVCGSKFLQQLQHLQDGLKPEQLSVTLFHILTFKLHVDFPVEVLQVSAELVAVARLKLLLRTQRTRLPSRWQVRNTKSQQLKVIINTDWCKDHFSDESLDCLV